MTNSDEPIHIQPAKAPLSDRGSRPRRPPRVSAKRNKTPRVIGFSVTMLVLGAVAAYVSLYLPQRVDPPEPRSTVGAQPPGNERPRGTKVVPPFEAADLANTR